MPPFKVDPSKVHEFVDEPSFFAWLRKNAKKETEVWIKVHKVGSGLPSITCAQAIDAALCWGWIDAIRKGFDEQSFLQRYTPRGKKSVWSKINVANVERLIAAGKMQPTGLAQVELARADGRWDNAYRMKQTDPPPDLLEALRAAPAAWKTWESLSSQNRFAVVFRVGSLKTPAGRAKKIAAFVEMLEKGETIYPQSQNPRRSRDVP